MQHYATDYPTSSLGESILPDNDYLPKAEDFEQALKLSDGEMGFYPTNAPSGHSSFGAHFLPHMQVAMPRGSPMNSMLSGHSSNSGANLLLMQKIESLQSQVTQYESLIQLLQTSAPTTIHRSIHSAENSMLSESSTSESQRNDECLYLLDDEEYPFPKYTVAESTVRPYPVMVVRCDGKEKTNLLVKAEPAPGYNFKLDNHIAYYKSKDQGYLHKPIGDIIIFELLHILDIGNAEGEQVQIDFSLYNIEGSNSVLLARRRSPPILVYNHSQYLPAPSIVKIVPSWATAGSTPQLDAYGPLFLRKNNILEAQVVELDGTPIASLGGKDISRKRNCFHSFSFDAPEHGPGQVCVRARYKGRDYGASRNFDYIQAPRPGKGGAGINLYAQDPKGARGGMGAQNGLVGGANLGGSSSSESSTHDYSGSVAYNAYNGNVKQLKATLKAVPAAQLAQILNAQDENGMTALFWASYAGHVDCVTELLSYGKTVKLGLTSKFGETALHAACYNGHANVVSVLLEAGAKHSIQQRDGLTPLHIAAYKGSVPTLLALLDIPDSGEDLLGSVDKDGMTPLHHAVLSGHVEALTLLIERCDSLGEPMFLRDGTGMSPLHWAAGLSDIDCVRELLKHASAKDVNLRDTSGETALHMCVRNGNMEITRELLGSRADPNAQDNILETPLFWAIRDQNNNIVQLLLEFSADPAIRNKFGRQPFQSVGEDDMSPQTRAAAGMATTTPGNPNLRASATNLRASGIQTPGNPALQAPTSLLRTGPAPLANIRPGSGNRRMTPAELQQAVNKIAPLDVDELSPATSKAGAELSQQLQSLHTLLDQREAEYKATLDKNAAEISSLKSTVTTLVSEMQSLRSVILAAVQTK
jgi:ankyrin repeat protein